MAPARHRVPLRAALAHLLAVALLTGGCSFTRAPEPVGSVPGRAPVAIREPPLVPSVAPGERVLERAMQYVGAPYRFGGSTPEGFDCSGLVVRAHELAGIRVPRTALEQHSSARPVPESALEPGDLVFFAARRGRVDHVGIYAGNGRFLHAPRPGRPVGYDLLDDPWFATRFVGAGRFWTAQPGEVAATGR
jgi:cell wall-associated NlpC family hydrolase